MANEDRDARAWVDPEAVEALEGLGCAEAGSALAQLFALEPERWFRRIPGRETFLVRAGELPLVVKRLRGGELRDWWYERLRARPLRSAARRECENLADLRADGVAVPRPLAWFEERRPALRPPRSGPRGDASALVMEYVSHGDTLRERLAVAGEDERAAWFGRVLDLALAMHRAGWYHRDLYLEHFVITEGEELRLLDAGRARRERRPRRRWFVKDLAALLHSLPPEVPSSEALRFLSRWLERMDLEGLASRRTWVRAVLEKRRRIAAHAPRFVDAGDGAVSVATPVRHLVVRAPNWVGDLVMATPVLEAALADPRFERVTIAVREHLTGVLRDGPCEGRLLALPRGGAAERRALAESGADAALLLSNSIGAAWRARRAGISLRAGAALGLRRWLLTHGVVPPTRGGRRVPIPTAHLQRDVAGLFGVRPTGLRPRLYAGAGCRRRTAELLARAGLGEGEPYALCCPGAAFGAAKLWPAERFAAVLDRLSAERGLRAVVTGAPGEEPIVAAVAGACRAPAVSLAAEPRDLESLKVLVDGARLVLVGDSGPRWYAAAFDVPCVSVMGPNFPELTASSLERCTIVRVEGLECAPCLQRRCPLGHHRCMTELTVERVTAAALEVLDRPALAGGT